jgi:anti-sigma factor RsiW
MNCRETKNARLLFLEGELPVRKARRLKKHLESCPVCRTELKEFESALDGLRAAAHEEERDWTDSEWSSLLARVTAQPIRGRRPVFRRNPRLAWAFGILFFCLVALSIVLFKPVFKNAVSPLPGERVPTSSAGASAAGAVEEPLSQNRLSVTLVSNESGLRVYWYFNKNFDWEEEK